LFNNKTDKDQIPSSFLALRKIGIYSAACGWSSGFIFFQLIYYEHTYEERLQ